ncbi:GGDEF domain-containing protein [Pseudomonas syringae pv. cerasicola]|uniref:GGDEF domain-containing protein n=1 Tax=Pseudomonas syringae pv. cerasicola TaxID=264451 RepID=A0A0P9NHJ5_PSESX|nr:GGDEF domain-containing protein [Pseudomonas syringae pv. cerasicola]RMS77891.1 GGDEF domain-containing protein [Pseudomonas savastanoi]
MSVAFMSFIRSPHMVRKYFYTLLWFYLFSIFLVAIAWEFKLESFAMYAINLPYDQDFEDAERWRFVLTSTGFALLSMVVPFILLKRLMQRLQESKSSRSISLLSIFRSNASRASNYWRDGCTPSVELSCRLTSYPWQNIWG